MYDFETGRAIIKQLIADKSCDLVKIGLLSGKKYDIVDSQTFVEWLSEQDAPFKIYLKDSLTKLSRYTNEELGDPFVTRSYNLFSNGTINN
jgi:hypothetical protein